MHGQWDIFPGFLCKPEVFPSLSKTCSWDTQGLGVGFVGLFGARSSHAT